VSVQTSIVIRTIITERCPSCSVVKVTFMKGVFLQQGTSVKRIGMYCPRCNPSDFSMILPPIEPEANPRKGTSRRVKRVSRKQEEDIAEKLGGKRHRGSGSVPWNKGDVRLDERARIEAKFTTKASYSVGQRELSKIRSECESTEQPVLIIDFKEKVTLKTYDRWAVVPFTFLEELLSEFADD